MLLLELSSAFAFLSLYAVAFRLWKHLLVLDAKFAAMQFIMVHCLNHLGGLIGRREVGESKAAKDSVIEMVVECVRKWETHVCHDISQLFLLDRERNVLDDNRGWNELIIAVGVELV